MKSLTALLLTCLCCGAQGYLPFYIPSSDSGSTLNSGLVSYWKLDEASGNRADSIGGNTLTDNGSVGSAAGKISNAASFTTSLTKFLSHASSSDFQITGDWTMCFWLNITAFGSTERIIVRDDFGANREYEIYINSSGDLSMDLFDSDGSDFVQIHGPTLSATTWYCIVVTYTAADKKARIYVNDGAESVSPALPNGPHAASAIFNISSSIDSPFGGLVDELGIWHKVFSSAERTEIYNSGAGKTTPF